MPGAFAPIRGGWRWCWEPFVIARAAYIIKMVRNAIAALSGLFIPGAAVSKEVPQRVNVMDAVVQHLESLALVYILRPHRPVRLAVNLNRAVSGRGRAIPGSKVAGVPRMAYRPAHLLVHGHLESGFPSHGHEAWPLCRIRRPRASGRECSSRPELRARRWSPSPKGTRQCPQSRLPGRLSNSSERIEDFGDLVVGGGFPPRSRVLIGDSHNLKARLRIGG